MNRIPDWQSILFKLLDEPVELVYGKTDCFLTSCNIVYKISGVDYADEIRGTYQDEAGADAKLKEWGGISGYLQHRIGEPIHPHAAQMGDFVLLEQEDTQVLGVCTGMYGAFMNHPPRKGLRSVRISLPICTKAWRT